MRLEKTCGNIVEKRRQGQTAEKYNARVWRKVRLRQYLMDLESSGSSSSHLIAISSFQTFVTHTINRYVLLYYR